jgi:hypothetical protein
MGAARRCAWCRAPRAGCATRASTAARDILPTDAPEGVQRVSPVEASARYLGHLRARRGITRTPTRPSTSRRHAHGARVVRPGARELTLEAARARGPRDRDAARGAAGRALRLASSARPGTGARSSPSATCCSWSTSAAAPPTSRSSPCSSDDGELARAHRGGRPHPARRRQHGPRARPRRRGRSSRPRAQALDAGSCARSRTPAASPRSAAGRRRRAAPPCPSRGGQPRREAGRQHDAHRAHARRGRRTLVEGFFPGGASTDAPASARAQRAHAARAALRAGRRDHAAPRRVPRRQAGARRAPRLPHRARPKGKSFPAPHGRAVQRRRLKAAAGASACWRCSTPGSRPTAAPPRACSGRDARLAVARGAAYYALRAAARRACASAAAPRAPTTWASRAPMPAVPGMEPPIARAVRRAVRHGRGHRGRAAAAGARPGGGRAGALPLLHPVGAGDPFVVSWQVRDL